MQIPSTLESVVLGLAFLFVATLFSSVGHGGASGYLAAMALIGLPPSLMRPSALCLNIVVTVIGTYFYSRAGYTQWKSVLLFVLPSAPAAFLGAMIDLPEWIYHSVVGLILLFAAWKTFRWGAKVKRQPFTSQIPVPAALMAGMGIGFLSGLTGVGGGIFLSPLLILAGWADTRHAAGISSAFILVNSIAGVLGLRFSGFDLPWPLPGWILCVCAGAFTGSLLGAKTISLTLQSRLLALVLAIAGLKMLFQG